MTIKDFFKRIFSRRGSSDTLQSELALIKYVDALTHAPADELEGEDGKKLLDIDIYAPRVYISHQAFLAFCCRDGRISDDPMLGFMAMCRLYIRYKRAYVRGLIESRPGEMSSEEESRIYAENEGYGDLEDDYLLSFWIATPDNKEIKLAGKAGTKGLSYWPFCVETMPHLRSEMEKKIEAI